MVLQTISSLPSFRRALLAPACLCALFVVASPGSSEQSGEKWPKKIDGYEVYQVGKDKAGELNCQKLVDILLVKPKRVTIDSLTVGLALALRPVPLSGEIHALRFDKMKLNEVPFRLAEYRAEFAIPSKHPILLPGDLDLTVQFADLQPALLRNLVEPDKDLAIEGTIIIFGTFKKFGIGFKRAVPVEFKTLRPNPLASFPALKPVIQTLTGRP